MIVSRLSLRESLVKNGLLYRCSPITSVRLLQMCHHRNPSQEIFQFKWIHGMHIECYMKRERREEELEEDKNILNTKWKMGLFLSWVKHSIDHFPSSSPKQRLFSLNSQTHSTGLIHRARTVCMDSTKNNTLYLSGSIISLTVWC